MKWIYIMTNKLRRLKEENKEEQLKKIKNYIVEVKLDNMK